MDVKLRFDRQKCVELILYVSSRCPDMYKLLKILYFADKEHLNEYGRLMCDDNYEAMKHGPVPIGAYEILRMAKGDSVFPPETDVTSAITVSEDNSVKPSRDYNDELISESEIECLDLSIEKYGEMSFQELKELSHQDEAYRSASEDDKMPIREIVMSLPDGQDVWDYLTGE